MTISTHKGLLHAICESPLDNTPRFVYADWLEENNQPQRAEFIRLQIKIGIGEFDRQRRTTLQQRSDALLREHVAVWRRPFREQQQPWFARGFVEQITVSAEDLLRREKLYFRRAPLLSLILQSGGDDPETVAKVAALSVLRQMQSLNLYEFSLEENAERFFSSARLHDLRSLTLGENDATPEIVEILARVSLSQLCTLRLWDFHGGALGNDGLRRLANTPEFAGLTTLDLLHNHVTAPGAQALAETPYLVNLEDLSLGQLACGYTNNRIGPEGCRALANSQALSQLRSLALAINHIEDDGLIALVESPYLRRLESLTLGINHLTDRSILALAQSPVLATMRFLDFSHNAVTEVGVQALVKTSACRNLETLWLWDNQVGRSGVHAIAESPYLENLRVLGLPRNPLGDDVIDCLIGSSRFANLEMLSLSQNHFSPDGVARLKQHFGERLRI